MTLFLVSRLFRFLHFLSRFSRGGGEGVEEEIGSYLPKKKTPFIFIYLSPLSNSLPRRVLLKPTSLPPTHNPMYPYTSQLTQF